MGWMVWDLMRGVDVLYQRPNIDKSKIMVFGSVAGGGDPCAVFAALDPRVTAAAPFNFGGPQPETPTLGEDAELAFNYMGSGSWESTRNLRLSARDGFLPWLIVGSIAPRGLIYGHEFAWDERHDPVWARFQKIWGFYDAADKLASAKGRGSVTGKPPESTHCNNIGFEHRKPMYPTLTKWFGLPMPEENKQRFQASELQCWTEEAKKRLTPKTLHEALNTPSGWPPTPPKERWSQLLGVKLDSNLSGEVSSLTTTFWDELGIQSLILRRKENPIMAVPMFVLYPSGKAKPSSIVMCISQDGKAGFLKHRAETIARLLKNNVAVCLPDLRGTGETAGDGRGRQSGGTAYSASLMMHGQTVPGLQLQELIAVMNTVGKGFKSMALWGDSFIEQNDPKMRFSKPLDVSNMPRQSEPMGATVALLGGVYGSDRLKAIYVRGGLASFGTLLNGPFAYVPHDAVIPSALGNDVYTLIEANKNRAIRLEAMVDGLNRIDKTIHAGDTVRFRNSFAPAQLGCLAG